MARFSCWKIEDIENNKPTRPPGQVGFGLVIEFEGIYRGSVHMNLIVQVGTR